MENKLSVYSWNLEECAYNSGANKDIEFGRLLSVSGGHHDLTPRGVLVGQ